MFKKNNIDLSYRIICLLTFCVVIFFSNNLLTLAILALFFFISTKNENNFLYIMFFFFTFVFLLFSYLGDYDSFLLKLIIMISYLYYFLIIPSFSKKVKGKVDHYFNKKYNIKEDVEKKTILNKEQEYLRFSKSKKNKKSTNDLPIIIYVSYHMVVLFLSIMLGGVFFR